MYLIIIFLHIKTKEEEDSHSYYLHSLIQQLFKYMYSLKFQLLMDVLSHQMYQIILLPYHLNQMLTSISHIFLLKLLYSLLSSGILYYFQNIQ